MKNERVLTTKGKFTVSMLLLVFAFFLALFCNTVDRYFCFIAMAFSSVGDILLMNYKNIQKKMKMPTFYLGAVAFMLSHLVYAYTYYTLIVQYKCENITLGMAFMVIFIINVTALTFTLVKMKGSKAKPIMWLMIVIYLGVISINCITIAGFTMCVGSWRALGTVGACSFFISDAVIAYEKLTKEQTALTRNLVWIFYPIGQVLILIAG